MNKTLNIQKSLIIFGIPLLVISAMALLTKSSLFSAHPNKLSIAIIADLLITTPFIYFLLIRKTSIPKTTVVPFIILGIVVCSFIIPAENQYYLNLFKTWMLPVIELSILSFVIYNIVKAQKRFKQNKRQKTTDFFTTLKSTCEDILPKTAIKPVVTEIAVLYYGFFYWKKRKLKFNEFTYHKDSGTVVLLLAIIFIIAIETVTLHYLLAKWNIIAAWILTGLSIYSGIQIFGFLKSMLKRPFLIEDDTLYLTYGIMNETTIPVSDIESIELSTKDIALNNDTIKLSFLGNIEPHNLVIKLRKENTLTGLYGIKRTYKVLLLHIDKKQDFKNYLEKKLIYRTTNL